MFRRLSALFTSLLLVGGAGLALAPPPALAQGATNGPARIAKAKPPYYRDDPRAVARAMGAKPQGRLDGDKRSRWVMARLDGRRVVVATYKSMGAQTRDVVDLRVYAAFSGQRMWVASARGALVAGSNAARTPAEVAAARLPAAHLMRIGR